jgi:S1-C subfamily serine protease
MRMSRALRVGLLGLVVIHAAPTRAADSTPIKVIAGELHPITFSRLVFRLDREDDIALGKAEFRVRFLEELRRLGYPAVGAESLIFDKDNSNQARFLLGGTVTDLDCNVVRGSMRPGRACAIAVQWEVMDADADRVVYRVTTKYELLALRGTIAQDSSLGRDLVMGAFHSLLARPRFVEALRRRGEGTAGKRFPAASFRACRAPTISMPRNADLVLKATVVLESEGGHGSGFLLSPDGLVLTAAHVARSAVRVRLKDGSQLEAAVVRTDPEADVALLRVKAPGPTACLALRQTPVSTGEEIYAVGAPLDRSLAFSLTKGIASGLREVRGTTLLQTDASINAGNSGGPLVDSTGHAAATVSAKLVGKGVEGVAFGVPVSVAMARLGLTPAQATDPALLQAAPPAAPEPVAVDDAPDVLHPVPTRSMLTPRAPRPAVIARPAAGPADSLNLRPLRKIGWFTGAAGLGLAAGTTIAYAAGKNHTQAQFDRLRLANDIGWAVTGAGALMVIAGYVFDGEPDGRVAAVGVGPTSISVTGRF